VDQEQTFLTQELNDYLPIRFNMQPSEQGFLFGGLVSRKTSNVYTADAVGLIAKIVNPWDNKTWVIVLAGNKAVGTKACVLALTNFWKKTLKDIMARMPLQRYTRIRLGWRRKS
jgi:hypothetical protein